MLVMVHAVRRYVSYGSCCQMVCYMLVMVHAVRWYVSYGSCCQTVCYMLVDQFTCIFGESWVMGHAAKRYVIC